MKIYLKSKDEVAKLREVEPHRGEVLDACEAACKPGVDDLGARRDRRRKLKEMGATSAFLGYHGYPAVLCTSVNEVVVHGIPRKDACSRTATSSASTSAASSTASAATRRAPSPSARSTPTTQKLMDGDAASRSSGRSSSACRATGCRTSAGRCSRYVEPLGYSVVREFVGHGIGRAMHEDPQVPNYGEPGRGIRLKPGLVLAIEPMVNAGDP